MKLSTGIILGVAGVGVVYLVTRPKTPPLTLGATTAPTSLLGGLGQFLGGAILGAGSSLSRPSSPGAVSSSSSSASNNTVGVGGNGDSEVAIVKSLDAGGISSYDAQSTDDAPVFGIAGLDY